MIILNRVTVMIAVAISTALLPIASVADSPLAVFAGPLDATELPADRRRLGAFAGFVERNAGKRVRIALQIRAPESSPKSIFSSWGRLERKLTNGKTLAGAVNAGTDLSNAVKLILAFCRCDGSLEAPYRVEVTLRGAGGATAPDIAWVDGRLLIRGVFTVVGPKQAASVRFFELVPAAGRGAR